MRRLPIYFLIDVSESMVGDPIEQVQDGMAQIINDLRTDPYSLETVFVSVIAFAGKAKSLSPLTELYKFYPPKFPIGGGTSLGNAMEFLMNDLDASIQKTTLDEKGDWKPIIFLFTDGNPTDNVDIAFQRWNNNYRKKANLIAVSLGDNIDTSILGKITNNVLQLKSTNKETFKAFFKWVTASVKTTSISISEQNDDNINLAPIKDDILTKIDLEKQKRDIIDENFAVVLGKCQTTHKSYLIKYAKKISPLELEGLEQFNVRHFKLIGAYPVDNSYYELSSSKETNRKISTNELIGFPTCPSCGNQYAFVTCECGNIFCVGENIQNKCPWCGLEGSLESAEGGIDVNRTRG